MKMASPLVLALAQAIIDRHQRYPHPRLLDPDASDRGDLVEERSCDVGCVRLVLHSFPLEWIARCPA